MSFVAVSKVKYPAFLRQDIHNAGLTMLPVAKKQAGLISISFHQSCDEDETIMVWEWESQANHEACMASSDWAAIVEQTRSAFESQEIEFSISTYERLG